MIPRTRIVSRVFDSECAEAGRLGDREGLKMYIFIGPDNKLVFLSKLEARTA